MHNLFEIVKVYCAERRKEEEGGDGENDRIFKKLREERREITEMVHLRLNVY